MTAPISATGTRAQSDNFPHSQTAGQATVKQLSAIPITAAAFRPFGQLIVPQPDDVAFNPQDAQLQLVEGTPRFYIMALHQRGRTFHTITRHGGCTQCLGSLAGETWYMGVAAPSDAMQPQPEDIKVFKIPGDCFIKLEVGTWHAGPYFDAATVNFYNLELSDTNVVDHTTCDLLKTYGVEFEIV
ncbi:MAG: ureidoglycolate lyase [Cyanobacteria bacterium J06598_1]